MHDVESLVDRTGQNWLGRRWTTRRLVKGDAKDERARERQAEREREDERAVERRRKRLKADDPEAWE